jgi:uncharacterized phage protein (TIGR02218 family)
MLRQIGIDLSQETLTLAVCVRIERQDGEVFCLTTHDTPIAVGGETYESMSGVDATAVRQEAGAGVDNLDVGGLVSSDRITEADLLAGRFDGAQVRLFVVDWRQPNLAPLRLLSGYLGNIRLQAGRYVAEVRSLAQRLGQQVGVLVSPTCRARALGDAECGVNLALYRATRTLAAAESESILVFAGDAAAPGYYSHGRVQFTSGACAGLAREIRTHTKEPAGSARLILQEALPVLPAPGDTAVLEAGCDRRLETCRDRFNNAVNFRGEPHVPGTETLLQRGRE